MRLSVPILMMYNLPMIHLLLLSFQTITCHRSPSISPIFNPDGSPLQTDLVNPPKAEEVLLDPLGRYAIVRQYGVDELVLVDFDDNASESVSFLEVGSDPTDMDVSAEWCSSDCSGTGLQWWIYDLADPTQTPNVIPMPESETFGSLILSGDDGQGVLYSTQTGDSRMGVWDRDEDEIMVRGTVKPISSVGISPTGETAVFSPKRIMVTLIPRLRTLIRTPCR